MTWQTAHAKSGEQLKSIFRGAVDLLRLGEVEIQMRNKTESRKDKQNRLSFHWYKEIAQQLDMDAEEVRAYCKLHFGVPILRKDNSYRETYDKKLRPLHYEQKLMLMGKPFDMSVTSLLSVSEFVEYLNSIEKHFTQQGVRLTTSDDLYFEAMMKDNQ